MSFISARASNVTEASGTHIRLTKTIYHTCSARTLSDPKHQLANRAYINAFLFYRWGKSLRVSSKSVPCNRLTFIIIYISVTPDVLFVRTSCHTDVCVNYYIDHMNICQNECKASVLMDWWILLHGGGVIWFDDLQRNRQIYLCYK